MGKGDRKTRRGKIYNGSFGKIATQGSGEAPQESQEGCRSASHSARRNSFAATSIPHDLQCRPLVGRQLDIR